MYKQLCIVILVIIGILVVLLYKNTDNYTYNKPTTQVVTYATHDEGMYQELINNKFDIPVKVLGFGTKWKGFMGRIKAYKDYLDNCDPNDIIIFVDGFDTLIHKPLDIAIKRFLDFDTEILMSKDDESAFNLLTNKVFGICKDNMRINGGLYMGYARSLKKYLNYLLNKNETSDDQRNMNSACKYFKNMFKIDENSIVFANLNTSNIHRIKGNYDEINACFIGFPGQMTLNRQMRGITEYYPFIKKEVDIIVYIVLIIVFTIVIYIAYKKYNST